MAERSGVITLTSFLKKYFHKRGADEGEIHRYYTIGADGLSRLHIHHMPIVKSTILNIDGTLFSAKYPKDYINYVFIAVEDEGKWWTFTRRNDMVDKSLTGITGQDLSEDEYIGGPGSVGGRNLYYFNVDHSGRRFLFDESYSGKVIVLKYKSSGVESTLDVDGAAIEFPIYAESALEAFIVWQIAEMEKSSLSERDWLHRRYKEEVMMMRNLHHPTVSEIRDLWSGSSNQTIIR